MSVAVCLICSAAALSAQNAASNTQDNFSRDLMQQLDAIKAAALNDDYAYRQLTYLTENIGPRSSGSAGAKASVEYVAAQMRELGLDVHLEEIKVRHWVRGAETAELVDYPGHTSGTQQKIVVTALGGSTSTGGDGITEDLVVVNNYAELSALGRDKIAGKVVLFNEEYDQRKAEGGLGIAAYRETVSYRETGPKEAADLGAIAALIRSIGSADYRLPHTGDSDPAGIPAGAISVEDAVLMSHLAAQGPVRIHLTLTPQKLPDETSYNVIGDLKGSEHPEQIVIVSGHLDSWDVGTGALDDAAGVVTAMETAELLQHLQLHPKRTLRVIAWMDEECDGAGSAQYRKENHNELANHVAAIESDVGAAHPLGFLLKMSKAAAESLKPVQAILASFGANIFQEDSHPAGVTDISPMSGDGVPVLGIMNDARSYYHYHHSAADTLDKVVPAELRENAAAMAVMTYALANMKNLLPH